MASIYIMYLYCLQLRMDLLICDIPMKVAMIFHASPLADSTSSPHYISYLPLYGYIRFKCIVLKSINLNTLDRDFLTRCCLEVYRSEA